MRAHARACRWHCGQSSQDLTPGGGGFSSSLGYLNGAEDHWNQKRPACKDANTVDLYQTNKPAFGLNGTYGAYIYRDEVLRIIKSTAAMADPKPLYLYMAFQINHAPLQVPSEYLTYYPCSDKNCSTRQTYQAMTVCLDDVLGNITAAMKAASLWDNTLFIFR